MFPFTEETIISHASLPTCPADWPEYGTPEFITHLKNLSSSTFEATVFLQDLDWQCFFDDTSAEEEDYAKPTAVLANEFYLQAVSYAKDDVMKIACSASSFAVVDRCQDRQVFPHAFAVGNRENSSSEMFASPRYFSAIGGDFFESTRHADSFWGLNCGRHTLLQELPLPFQATVFMTPDNWCLINLGINSLDATAADLSSVWSMLEYFTPYFNDEKHGHPGFASKREREYAKSALRAREGQSNTATSEDREKLDDDCMNMDFRLWLVRPSLVIPSSATNMKDPCLCIESRKGLFYRYKSVGFDFCSQEVCTSGMTMVMTKDYKQPREARGLRGVSGADVGVKTLIENLSFGILYDCDSKHTNVSISMPLGPDDTQDTSVVSGIEAADLQVQPLTLAPPTVCKPVSTPTRYLGTDICDLYFSYDYLDLAMKQLVGFVQSPILENNSSSESQEGQQNKEPEGAQADSPTDEKQEYTFSVCCRVSSFRAFLCDPLLGMHHPIAAICIPSLVGSVSQLPEIGDSSNAPTTAVGDVVAHDLQGGIDLHVWADYFKIASTRSWEPLIEPYKCVVLYEKSSYRGHGITYNSDCPLHVNVSGALLETIDDTMNSFSSFRMGVFGKAKTYDHSLKEMQRRSTLRLAAQEERNLLFVEGHVIHRVPAPLQENDRVAFSLTNNTGEKMRIHQAYEASQKALPGPSTSVAYLDNMLSLKLAFPATKTLVKNLELVEVNFEKERGDLADTSRRLIDSSHTVDVQIPGFKWVKRISADAVGKRFYHMIPRSPPIREKLSDDWRLANAIKLLAEVGSSWSGGRQVALSSPFTITNNTSHKLALTIHPNPRHAPSGGHSLNDSLSVASPMHMIDSSFDDYSSSIVGGEPDISELSTGETYQVPLLLLESSLHVKGNHLGEYGITSFSLNTCILRVYFAC